jgi:hypothetical protein
MQAVFLLKKTQVNCISEVMHRRPVWEYFPGLKDSRQSFLVLRGG